MSICKLINIDKHYKSAAGEVVALRQINIEINAGEFVVLAGPSGSGKTTLANIIGFLDEASAGCYKFQGTDISEYKAEQRTLLRRSHVGFVFQSFNLMSILTAKENVAMACELSGVTTAEAQKKALEMLDLVSMADCADRYPNQLSGGQQQRVAIARAMVKQPTLLVADEPTASLDSHNTEDIIALMIQLNKTLKSICVVCTHDERVIRNAPRLLHLDDGYAEEQ